MELCPNPIRSAFPGLERFRVLLDFFQPAFQFNPNFGMNLIAVLRGNDFRLVLVKPVGKPAAFLARELQQGVCNLLHAHGGNLPL